MPPPANDARTRATPEAVCTTTYWTGACSFSPKLPGFSAPSASVGGLVQPVAAIATAASVDISASTDVKRWRRCAGGVLEDGAVDLVGSDRHAIGGGAHEETLHRRRIDTGALRHSWASEPTPSVALDAPAVTTPGCGVSSGSADGEPADSSNDQREDADHCERATPAVLTTMDPRCNVVEVGHDRDGGDALSKP